MSETPGLPSALGIEAVEWLAQGESVTVRLQGRWRRRRAIAAEQARVEPERLSAAMAELGRARLVAERRAHAERARRHELEDQLAELHRAAAADRTEELAAAARRVRELEDEVRQLVRRLDQA